MQYDPLILSICPYPNQFQQVLFASGDGLAQQVVDRKGLAKHDFARTGRMALYGGGMFCAYIQPHVHMLISVF